MKIRIEEGLPFVSISLVYRGNQVRLDQVVVDTGSAGTIFKFAQLRPLQIQQNITDEVHRISGVGGTEFVFSKRMDQISLGNIVVRDFEIEIGSMDYGFPINGILGLDFLRTIGAIIDLKQTEIYA